MKTDNKLTFVLLVLFAVTSSVDFILFDQKLSGLLLATGFLLLAYSLYKDKPSTAWLPMMGVVIAIGGFITKWFFDVVVFDIASF